MKFQSVLIGLAYDYSGLLETYMCAKLWIFFHSVKCCSKRTRDVKFLGILWPWWKVGLAGGTKKWWRKQGIYIYAILTAISNLNLFYCFNIKCIIYNLGYKIAIFNTIMEFKRNFSKI